MNIKDIIKDKEKEFIDVAFDIWTYAEVGYKEFKSSKRLCDCLREEGFKVNSDIPGLPTAFVAEYGSGRPIVAFWSEYDALPGLSQKVKASKEPSVEGAPGHGCGHNLLGTASLAAAVAIKELIKSGEIKGTVRLYGTPAEELLTGKVVMVKMGLFDDVDAVIGWHPERLNMVMETPTSAVYQAKFHYKGKTAHAAVDPWNGRSALDAVELLNISANYLREHVPPGTTLHYSTITDPLAPNIVPENATAWYFVRAQKRDVAKSVYERLVRCAKAAAEMTDTHVTVEFCGGCSDYLPNRTIEKYLHKAMESCDPISYTEEEMDFISEMTKTLPGALEASQNQVRSDYGINVNDKLICDFFAPLSETKRKTCITGSMDIGDVSYIVPTAQINIACYGYAIAGHSWQVAAYAGHSVGMKGMLKAGEVMAKGAKLLFEDPEIIDRAKEELKESLGGKPYESPLPEGYKPF